MHAVALLCAALWPALCPATVSYPEREVIALEGRWQYTPLRVCEPGEVATGRASDSAITADFSDSGHPLSPLALEPTGPPEMVAVPQPGLEARAPFGALERSLEVPHIAPGWRAVLRFSGVGFACEVLVNGGRAGAHWGPFGEFELDVTELLSAGSVAVVRVIYASEEIALRPRTDAETYPGGPPRDVPVLWHPRGKTRDIRGIWRGVCLELRPACHLADLSVETRPVGPRLTLTGSIPGAPTGLRVTAEVADGRGAVWTVGPVVAEHGRFRLTGRCPGAALWSPDSPRLYRVTVSLLQGERLVDRAVFPVGFREIKARGAGIYLNGRPLRLYGTSVTDPFLSKAQIRDRLAWFRGLNMNTVRFHGQPHPEHYLDAADEVGILVVDESDLFGTCDAAHYPYGDATFDRAVEAGFREWITRDRLHPSVVVWSLENEVAAAWPHPERGPLTRWLASLAAVTRRYDHTRPLEYESDGDPLGVADIVCVHYPGEGYCATGVHGQLRPATTDKPFMVGEFGFIDDSKGAAARWVGDDAYYEPTAQAEGVRRYLQATIEGQRRNRVDGIVPFQWHYAEPCWAPPAADGRRAAEAPLARELRRLFAPVLLSLTDDEPTVAFDDAGPVVATVTDGSSYVSGEMIRKTVHIQSDLRTDLQGRADWSLSAPGKTAVAGGTTAIVCPADGVAEAKLAFAAPEVADTTEYRLTIRVPGVAERTAPIVVYPASLMAPPRISEPLGLYDVSGETEQALRAMRVPLREIADFAGPLPRLVVIGRESVDGKVRTGAEALGRHVSGGGTVVVCEQRDLSGLDLPVELTAVGEQRAFITPHAPGHPLFAGLRGNTLGPWRGYPAGLRSSCLKPATGRFRALAGASGHRWIGSPTLAILEVLQGRGRYVICQAEVIGHYSRDPQATLLAHNLLAWAADLQPAGDPASCAVVHGDAAPLTEALARVGGGERLGRGLEGLSPERGDVAVVMANDGVEGLEAQSARLEAFAKAGGTVLCLGAKAASWSSDWLPAAVSIAEPSESRYVLPVRGVPQSAGTGSDPLLWGLSAADLSAGDVWDEMRRVHDPFTDWSPSWQALAWAGPAWTADRWRDFATTPQPDRAAVLKLSHGKGRYLLVQAAILPRESPYSPLSTAAQYRVFCTLLTNLNLKADPAHPRFRRGLS
jgi:hypothetical protein